MVFDLTVLGNNSAAPTLTRNQSGQHLSYGGLNILIDCGEGTQKRLMQYGINFQKISAVFISHLHGDHYLGLFGLLNTLSLNGRKKPLTVYSPPGLRELHELSNRLAVTFLTYDIRFVELVPEHEATIDLGAIEVKAIPVTHRVPCFSFLFIQKQEERPLNIEACKKYDVPVSAYKAIKKGADFKLEDGRTIANKELTHEHPAPVRYGYVTDTIYRPDLADRFHQCNAVYHEATYLHNFLDRAEKTFHSTAQQAAQFASQAAAKQLLIGHFSSRYDKTEGHLNEAKRFFEESYIAEEGETFEIS